MQPTPRATPSVTPDPADAPEVLARFRSQLDLVDLIARQVGRRVAHVVTLDDLRSFGREGLLQAARTFDESRGVPFRRWANLRVRGAMIDGVRRWGDLPRRVYRELRAIEAADHVLEAYDEEDAAGPATSPQAADSRLTSYLTGLATAMAVGGAFAKARSPVEPEDRGASPEDLVADAELADCVRKLVAKLPERERALVDRHYFGGETLEAAAASLGLSKSWGSRLHARAIESMARGLRKLGG